MSARELKEQHVSGLHGTSLWEVSAIASVPVLLLVVLGALATDLGTHRQRDKRYLRCALEFAVLVLPNVGQLLGAIRPQLLAGLLLLGAAAFLLLRRSLNSTNRVPQPAPLSFREALASYRACLMIITCIAILGVDFHAFPRRFAKAETFGTGLMDVGVGSFVAASGVGHGLSGRGASGQVARDATRVVCLAALGAGRLLFTAAADYQKHVGEYGVHWTFFLTLAALQLANMLLPWPRRSAARAACVGVAVLACYQYALSRWSLIDWVHSDERGPGLLSANKEGLASLAGYWALQLLGVALGRVLAGIGAQQERGRGSTRSASGFGAGYRAAAQQVVMTAGLWLAYWAAAAYLQPVSRRACNASYVLWILALTSQSIFLCWAALRVTPVQPLLVAAIAGNTLPVFLAANLLTGAVNMGLDTLAASNRAAVATVALYMALVCLAAVALPRRAISKKDL